MPDHATSPPPFRGVARGRFRWRPSEEDLFGVTYGLVLASALVAALEGPGEASDPGADSLWILLTAVAAAAAHGYARVIARRATAGGTSVTKRLRAVLEEWPLVAAVLPSAGMLAAAVAGWWPEPTAVDAALAFNTAALFGWGTWTARVAGWGRAASLRSGCVDMVIGLVIVGANAVIK